jgi:hypothetical protein
MDWLRQLWKALLLLLIFTTLIAIPGIMLAFGYIEGQPFIVYISAVLLSLSVLLILFWLILSSVFNFIFSNIYCKLKGNITTKLVGLGLASFLFTLVPLRFLSAPFIFLSTLTFSLSNNVLLSWQVVESACNSASAGSFDSDCTAAIIKNLFSFWIISIITASSRADFSNLPFAELIIFIAIWAFCVEIIFYVTSLAQANNDKNWMKSLIKNQASFFSKSTNRSNTAFFAILGLGLYLSIASIAAIPSLQDTTLAPEKMSVEELKVRLDKSMKDFDQKFPIPEANTPSSVPNQSVIGSELSFIDELKKTLIEISNKKLSPNVSTNITQINMAASKAISLRELLASNRNQFLRSKREALEAKSDAALTNYEASNFNRKGSRETVNHFLAISSWFDSTLASVERDLKNCDTSISSIDNDFRAWSISAKTMLQESSESSLDNFANSSSGYLENLYRQYSQDCQYGLERSYSNSPIPVRQSLGGSLGPFSFVAGWLLGTESLPLTLITGLIGFGLLGSACSSFVRERIDENIKASNTIQPEQNVPLVQDLSKVVIIGVSAAVLAFLSVMGGLTIFFASGSSLNPYALLLTCLIAAAFGEDIWKWAHDQLKKRREKDLFQSSENPKKSKADSINTVQTQPANKPASPPPSQPDEQQSQGGTPL